MRSKAATDLSDSGTENEPIGSWPVHQIDKTSILLVRAVAKEKWKLNRRDRDRESKIRKNRRWWSTAGGQLRRFFSFSCMRKKRKKFVGSWIRHTLVKGLCISVLLLLLFI
jgi:hypothetical protein